ncbi:M15 family metallopeptidase [Stenotrophomonas tumulicola]|uniref:M15 family metallopeptidase n=1 Tax=Stenotrophomonas tumulicola TaxID=1685415 RepID=A0A7W3IHM2_9GAMM|nr:M15 family metallopeptidase [Stenotrophomonas tumulicola]
MIALVLVFAIACGLLLFPSYGERLRSWVSDWQARGAERRLRARTQRMSREAERQQAPLSDVREDLGGMFDTLRRLRWVIGGALLLVLLPSLAILVARRTVVLDDFRGQDLAESTSMVAQLLRGERLAPPPPPPPEVFTTEEIRRTRPEVVTADRRWDSIDAGLQQRVLAIFEVMRRQHGYEMVLVEGYRSPERQAELMAGGQATRAGAWQSCHQYGLAIDAAPIRDGKLQWDMGDAWTRQGYMLYGELAAQAGLEWGGSWRSIKDYVHVELASACRSARAAKRAELARG